MLLIGQALLVGLAARHAYTLSQSAELIQAEPSAQTVARLTGIVAQHQALSPFVYAAWLVSLVGGGLAIALTVRRQLRWPMSGAILLVVGHLTLLAGLYVLPIALSAPPFPAEAATEFSTLGFGRWFAQLAHNQAISAVVALVGWLFNGVACGLAWHLTHGTSGVIEPKPSG